MSEFSIEFSDIVSEARYGMTERFGKHVDVIAYNPTQSTIPHLVVLFRNPKKDYDDPVTQEIRRICIPLENPAMTYDKRINIDFEPTFEDVLVNHNLPFQVVERQKRMLITQPKYDPRMPTENQKGIFLPILDHFGADTGTDFDKWYKNYSKDLKSYKTIDKGLRVRKENVYVPKEPLPKRQSTFVGGTFTTRRQPIQMTLDDITRQPKGVIGQTEKYYIKERQDGQRTVIPDIFYYLKESKHLILGEVKPWTERKEDTIKERAAQICNYDAAMRYNNDRGITSIALVIPEIASVKETRSLENVQEKTGRQILVIAPASRDYLVRRTKQREDKLKKIMEFAETASLSQLQNFLGVDIEECKDEIRLLEKVKDNLL